MESLFEQSKLIWRPPFPSYTRVEALRRYINHRHGLRLGKHACSVEYVKYSLQEYPWRSFVAYLGLTAAVAWHAAEGMGIIWNTWLRPIFGAGQTRKQRTIGAFAGGVLPVATGLFFMWREPLMVFSSHAARFNAALRQSAFFGF